MRPNGLLKVVSILYIVLAAIEIVLGALVAALGGSVLGAAAESVGVGVAVGGTLVVLLLAKSIYSLVCGIVGVKGKFTACKVLGIIALVFAIISAAASLFTTTDLSGAVVSAIAGLVLPILYVVGAYKGPQQ